MAFGGTAAFHIPSSVWEDRPAAQNKRTRLRQKPSKALAAVRQIQTHFEILANDDSAENNAVARRLLHFWTDFMCVDGEYDRCREKFSDRGGRFPAAPRNSQLSSVAGRTRKMSQVPMWRCAAVIAAATVSGCTSLPSATAQTRTQRRGIRIAPAQPAAGWNRAELLALALKQNPELAVAQAEVDAACRARSSPRRDPIRTSRCKSEYARHDSHPWLYGVSFNWLLRSRRTTPLGNGDCAARTPAARACS